MKSARRLALLLLAACVASPLLGALEKQPASVYHQRRVALAEKLRGGVAVLFAAEEPLLEIKARDRVHQIELAWHLGNRHLAAQIEDGRILIERDHVIKAMLEGLGATVTEITEPFSPVHGAYHSHGGHGDHDHHNHGH